MGEAPSAHEWAGERSAAWPAGGNHERTKASVHGASARGTRFVAGRCRRAHI